MKSSVFLFFLIALAKISYGQQSKQTVDYQYFRDDKQYYAFELYKTTSLNDEFLMLNFTSNVPSKKIDKIYIQKAGKEIKLKFKSREDAVSSDNPELKFYPVIFGIKDLNLKEIGCEAKFIFKMDNGLTYTLPLVLCSVSEDIAKN